MAEQPGILNIVEFGPARGIGMAMPARAGVSDFKGLWQQKLGPRMGEIVHPANCVMFGVCRCIPGVTDGTFEYVALMEAAADAKVPAGMVAVDIPRVAYAAFEVSDYSQFHIVWQNTRKAIAAQSEWKPYCGPEGCDCATHPAFEYYPPDSYKTGRAMVYVPVKRG